MCTAISYLCGDHYFGRTLDYERSFGEEVVLTPRNVSLPMRHGESLGRHYAILGMAHVAGGYPLYYDAVNEKGLCVAGLNFPGFARYGGVEQGRQNVACFELIPWLLGRCADVEDAREALACLRITGTPFSPDYPTAQLHWLLADREQAIVLEPMEGGLRIHDNPIGVLTNTPPFDDQMFQLRNFMHLSANPPHNHFSPHAPLTPYSRGMGAIGLPGDLSSQSRFVRAAFTMLNSACEPGKEVSQAFHILGSVEQTRGCCRLADGSCEHTLYTAVCNASKGIYYYTTYSNRRITAIEMHRVDLDGDGLIRFPLMTGEDIRIQHEHE